MSEAPQASQVGATPTRAIDNLTGDGVIGLNMLDLESSDCRFKPGSPDIGPVDYELCRQAFNLEKRARLPPGLPGWY